MVEVSYFSFLFLAKIKKIYAPTTRIFQLTLEMKKSLVLWKRCFYINTNLKFFTKHQNNRILFVFSQCSYAQRQSHPDTSGLWIH